MIKEIGEVNCKGLIMFNYKLFIYLFILLIPLTSSQLEVGGGGVIGEDLIGVEIFPPSPIIFDNNTAAVNSSSNWVTPSLGTLSDGNSTQFLSVAGTLTIVESYMDGIWCRINGCTMTGDLTLPSGGKFRLGNPPADNIGIAMDGDAFFTFSDSMTGTSPNVINIINNFNNYLGLILRRSGTGTGNFIEGQDSDGTQRFLIDRYGGYTTTGNISTNILEAEGVNITGLDSSTSFTVKNFNIVSSSLMEFFAPVSVDVNTGKVFSIKQEGSGFATGMFYSDGKYCIGGGSATRDTCLSRSDVNKFTISSDGANGAADLDIKGNLTVNNINALGNLTAGGILFYDNGTHKIMQF